MESLRVLVTGGGSPGIAGTITVDMKENVPGKYIADGFYKVHHGVNNNRYYKELYTIAASEDIDVILPQISDELFKLSSDNIGIPVAISNPRSIQTSSDKYILMKIAHSIGVPTGRFRKLYTKKKLEQSINGGNDYVLKPCISNGSRGLRIVTQKAYNNNFFEKPDGVHVTKETLLQQLKGIHKFKPMIMMQKINGMEYSVDCYRDDDTFIAIPRKRLQIRSGISFECQVEKQKRIINASKKLANSLKLEGTFGFQFILTRFNIPYIIECNPRVQGSMVTSTLAGANLIYSGVKYALDEKIPNFNVDWDKKMVRYWGFC